MERCRGGEGELQPVIEFRSKVVGWRSREIAFLYLRTDGVSVMVPCLQEKLLSDEAYLFVPQTDTGGQVENTKAFERSQAKELCNLLL